jgi:branched-chain amino acid transport system permease protein
MSFAIQYTIFLLQGPLGGPSGANAMPSITMFVQHPVFDVFGTLIYDVQLIIIAAAVILMVATDLFIRRGRTGRGIRAVAQDPDTATLMGVNKERIIMITFVLGGLLAGAAALFYVMLVPSGVIYNGGFILGVKAFAAAVLGGIGNVRGALLGGLLLGVIANYGQILLGDAQWADVVSFVVLVLVLLIRPEGILGQTLGRSRA